MANQGKTHSSTAGQGSRHPYRALPQPAPVAPPSRWRRLWCWLGNHDWRVELTDAMARCEHCGLDFRRYRPGLAEWIEVYGRHRVLEIESGVAR